MARSKEQPNSNDGDAGAGRQHDGAGNSGDGMMVPPGMTGRYLVLLQQGNLQAGVRSLTDDAGLRVTMSADEETDAGALEALASGEAVVFDQLAVAVVDMPPDQVRSLNAAASRDSAIMAIEPERVVYAIDDQAAMFTESLLSGTVSATAPVSNGGTPVPEAALPLQYLIGYRDAVNTVIDQVLRTAGVHTTAGFAAATTFLETELTWGLQATKVPESRFSGRGVRVAVLDTGLDLGHPDFVGRRIVSRSFVQGESEQDGHGHGTHCTGTACGPRQGYQMPRYGIAYDAEIYIGKVLSNRGSGTDSSILAGIQWAIRNNCDVISMSLGAATQPGQTYSVIYEAVAQRALAANTLIIAAAGNESRRPGQVNPVGHPANCPSIMAVAAIDAQGQVAYFSCGGINLQGGQVDIAGPGVAVRSAWPRPMLYRNISGTSMATPHVAGIAALLAEQNPNVRGGALGWLLLQSARRLDLPAQDIGAGLVQAP